MKIDKYMWKKRMTLPLAVIVFLTILLTPLGVHAASNATITGPSKGEVGKTITVTLGFPSVKTVAYDITIQYDEKLLGSPSASDHSGLSKASVKQLASNKIRVGAFNAEGDEKTVSKAASVTFKVTGKGTATIQIVDASNGPENLGTGAKVSITLADPAPTTTTVPKTTTTTTPKTTTTTKATTPTSSTASTTPTTTLPDPDRHPSQALIGKRYDGVSLFVPETIPSDDLLPEGFEALDMLWEDKQLTGYNSETLPYELFWLIDEEGETRLYIFDQALDVFMPFLRVEWSSRFYTLSLLSDAEVPQGFELASARIWGEEVPAYRPLAGFFLTKAAYDAFLAQEDQEGEGDLPQDIYLLALRMNDSEKKGLYLYDRGIDSLIRADLWLVPVAGSILDPDREPLPSETGPSQPSDPEVTEPAGSESQVNGSTINLFGIQLPLYLLLAGAAGILLLAALLVWFLKARKAGKYEPELTMADLDQGHDEELPSLVEEESDDAQEDLPEVRDAGIEEELDPGLEEAEEEALAEEAVFQEVPPSEELEDGWAALNQTLLELEEKKRQENQARAPGIRPLTHRRLERDDPEDKREL